jgi:hypothetical protein
VEAGIQVAQNIASDAPDPTLPTGEEGQAELEDLCDALKRENPRQAERLEEIARGRARAALGEHQGEHSERVMALIAAGEAGWVNDLKGDFVGNGNRAILVQRETGLPIVDGEGNHFHIAKRSTSPQAATVSEFINYLQDPKVEGFFSFMYKDSGDNVTIGSGTNLTALGRTVAAQQNAAVKTLIGKAFNLSVREFSSGPQIREAYATVLNSPLQNNLGTPEEAEQFRPLTDIRISEVDARKLAATRFRTERNGSSFIDSSGHYPDFDHAPRDAQIVAFDIIYTNGGRGFDGYPRFKKAYNRKDWEQANTEQAEGRSGNRDRMALIREMLAGLTAAEPFFIDFDAEPGQGIDIDDL